MSRLINFLVAAAVLAVVALLAATAANAQTVPVPRTAARVSWVNATTDANGDPLPASGPGAITQTRIQRSLGANCLTTFGTVAQTLNVTPDVNSVLFENLEVGRHCFRARHISLDEFGVELLSDWSAVVSKVVAAPIVKTRPPTITIE